MAVLALSGFVTGPRLHAFDGAQHTLLLDGAIAGEAVIAVGERGTIVRSTDNGATWQPAKTPTLATLTGVAFADALHGWAVGHDALILTTRDGGLTWAKQWEGENLSDSLLDVAALDAEHVIAIGAYGLYLSSDNGGATWTSRKILPDDYHLNRITRNEAGVLYLAGEHGTLLRSADGGQNWRPIPSAYDGSFYGILPLRSGTLLAYGLRGRIFRSEDQGAHWTLVPTDETELLATGVEFAPHVVALAGQTRALLVSTDDGRTFARTDVGVTSGVAELLALPLPGLLAFGEAGATRIEPQRLRFPAGKD